ncbi:hypothetical protein ABLA82_23430, partial [Vibrio parahaemolyticus]
NQQKYNQHSVPLAEVINIDMGWIASSVAGRTPMILKLPELASQEKTAFNDDRLPSVVIGLLSLK